MYAVVKLLLEHVFGLRPRTYDVVNLSVVSSTAGHAIVGLHEAGVGIGEAHAALGSVVHVARAYSGRIRVAQGRPFVRIGSTL